MKLLIRNGRVVDPASGLDEPRDLLIDGDRIEAVDRDVRDADAEIFDATGCIVCPGFLDMHVHLREPGQEWKETIETGTRAAARGGFTAVSCMPNTVPVNDTRSVTEFILRQARERGVVEVYPVACVTKGQRGEELAEMEDLYDAGARGFSDDGKPVRSALTMRRALEYSRTFDQPIIDHCEDPALVDSGCMNEGAVSTRLGLRGWPSIAEDVMVERNVLLAEYTSGHVHIAHMSTGRGAAAVRRAKERGVRATCEVTPHHLLLTDAAVGDYDTNAKVNPPLRSEEDRLALLDALADGTVDAIATDHAPHHRDEKCVEFANAPFGLVGLETAVSLCLDRLVRKGLIDLRRMVELFTTGPAGVLGLDRGRLAAGARANVTILDLDREVTVDPAEFASKGRNTPFAGWTLRGAPVATFVGGKLVFASAHEKRPQRAERERRER